MGLAARIFSQACRKLNPLLKEYGSTIIWVSQTRQKIGVTWGDNTVVGVGNALKFYASVRIKVQRTGSNKESGETVSNTTKATVKKNKTAPPFKEATFDIKFGEGIDWKSELIDIATEQNIVKKSGSWFEYTDESTGEILRRQGKTNFQADLSDDQYQIIRKKILTL
jgi:recombination protein RecA